MEKNQMKTPKKNTEKFLWGILIATVAIILGLALFLALYMPNVEKDPQFSTGETTSGEEPGGNTSPYERKDGFYTFLVAGIDTASNNTDVQIGRAHV